MRPQHCWPTPCIPLATVTSSLLQISLFYLLSPSPLSLCLVPQYLHLFPGCHYLCYVSEGVHKNYITTPVSSPRDPVSVVKLSILCLSHPSLPPPGFRSQPMAAAIINGSFPLTSRPMSVQPLWLFCSFQSHCRHPSAVPLPVPSYEDFTNVLLLHCPVHPKLCPKFLFLKCDFRQLESGSKPSLAPHCLANYVCSPQLSSGVNLSRTLFPTVPLINWTPRGSWLHPLFPVCPLSPSAVLWFPPTGTLPVAPPSCRVQPELICETPMAPVG